MAAYVKAAMNLRVTDAKGAYEKVNGVGNATLVMNTARVDSMPPSTSASEMITSPFSGVVAIPTSTSGMVAQPTSGADAVPMVASKSSQVCSGSVFALSDRAFKNRLKTYIALNLTNHESELKDILECVTDEMQDILKRHLSEYSALKFNIFYCILSKYVDRDKNFTFSYENRPDLECKYDWCIDFPVGIKDIAKFEKRNDISINVFALDENDDTLGEYSDLYLKSDTLILTDVFENFREMCLKAYDLDCMYYYTVPGLAYSAMLKLTGVELQLIKDMTMLLLFEQGIRGGICQCVTRHAVANDPKSDNFDDSKSPSAIYYVDANNLYGFAMSQKLPYGGFAWLTDEEIHHFDLQAVNDDSEIGYVLEVDIEYPNHLFEKHRDLPFCAEFAKPPDGKHKKLLTTLHSKQNYVAHYKLLQQAVDHGLQIVKIHRAIKFKQSHWLKQYIDLNTEMRRNANNDFEKDFFKLMNNAVFGKTMENVRKRTHFRLVSNDEKLKKLISKPHFLDRVIYAENLVGIHLRQTQILFDKALYVGMCILELSKVHMYNFHHRIMKEQFGDKFKLCYMDTDSFIYLAETDDLYHDLQNVRDHLDTSVYSPNHILYSIQNKGVLGKFKDEIPNSHIDEFVGLKAKVYALKCSDFEIKKLKGIKKSYVDSFMVPSDGVVSEENSILAANSRGDGEFFQNAVVYLSFLETLYISYHNGRPETK
ncbi:hypothetical protein ANN_07299 [Periplaneta americana]|uniref:DNA-directed DNA polymerase n=1 Tax=Periplaneta americana TaxID=6978 RepID=A0ABQ8TH69_PERAM|nr:hypothetical protein ANN_07299 [Periplaneta americana]